MTRLKKCFKILTHKVAGLAHSATEFVDLPTDQGCVPSPFLLTFFSLFFTFENDSVINSLVVVTRAPGKV